MKTTSKTFDLFISYKSEDHEIAQNLLQALEARGVRVWLDKDQIRPGDHFAEALERGLETSRAVALLITPESLSSNWVKNEYYRALSLTAEGRIQLVPVICRDAVLPGFLATRQSVDLRTPDLFQRAVDQLVWPGITGKTITFCALRVPVKSRDDTRARTLRTFERWQQMEEILQERGIKLIDCEDVDRAPSHIKRFLGDDGNRIVVIVDPFEGWPDLQIPATRNSPKCYADLIFELRSQTKGQSNEVVFLLLNHSEAWAEANQAWSSAKCAIEGEQLTRLRRYFAVNTDLSAMEFGVAFEAMLLRVQRDLLVAEQRSTAE